MESQQVRCPFLELSSYAPGGRNFPELTKCEYLSLWQGGGMNVNGGTVTVTDTNIYSNDAGIVSGPFPELSSYAPGGRNFPEHTKREHFPGLLLAGRWCLRLLWHGFIN